jgi:tetratricopeptide (TPR) repeat protein/tRNA A-37 threonylcarbamoyl transferase component Bud32
VGRFGRFNLLQRIAVGGMGVVFKAEELADDGQSRVRLVALKQILGQRLDSPGALERFRRETQAAKRLDHPGIVPVFESGEVAGEHYFTMPFVPGGSLQQHVTGNRLTPRQAARLMGQVAEAVQYAHDKGVIHRDLKPQNILLQPNTPSPVDAADGGSYLSVTPRLTDFGLARLVTEDSTLSLSQKGDVMGTPGYMPPEQARGILEQIGPRSDVYGLGAVLYALLTGRPPFPRDPSASVLETLRQVVDGEPIRPTVLYAGVPAELEDICLKCLQKEPGQRYATARQLTEALDDFLANRPRIRHTPRRAGWLARYAKRLGRSVRNHPLRAVYIAASVAAIVTLMVVLYSLREAGQRWATDLRNEAETKLRRGEEAERAGRLGQALEEFASAREKYAELIRSPRHLEPGPLQLALAKTAWRRGDILRRERRTWQEADEEFNTALRDLGSIRATAGEREEYQTLLAEVYHGLGTLLSNQKTREKLSKALEFYQKALPLRKSLSERDKENRGYMRDLARNYGWMGDTQLELEQRDYAEASYRTAAELREKIVGLIPSDELLERLEAHCQRARDYGNMGNLYERTGRPREALEQYRIRAAHYKGYPFQDALTKYHQSVNESTAPLAARLPGEFWTDRADCFVTMAGLQLDLKEPTREPLQLLQEALDEYDTLISSVKGQENNSLQSGMATLQLGRAQVLLVQGKGLWLNADAKNRDSAFAALDSARRIFSDPVVPKSADEYYSFAVAYAWLGRVAPILEPAYNKQALEELERAVHEGFRHSHRLEREEGFARLRVASETAQKYKELITTICQEKTRKP